MANSLRRSTRLSCELYNTCPMPITDAELVINVALLPTSHSMKASSWFDCKSQVLDPSPLRLAVVWSNWLQAHRFTHAWLSRPASDMLAAVSVASAVSSWL